MGNPKMARQLDSPAVLPSASRPWKARLLTLTLQEVSAEGPAPLAEINRWRTFPSMNTAHAGVRPCPIEPVSTSQAGQTLLPHSHHTTPHHPHASIPPKKTTPGPAPVSVKLSDAAILSLDQITAPTISPLPFTSNPFPRLVPRDHQDQGVPLFLVQCR